MRCIASATPHLHITSTRTLVGRCYSHDIAAYMDFAQLRALREPLMQAPATELTAHGQSTVYA
jgi:hypothetical protein